MLASTAKVRLAKCIEMETLIESMQTENTVSRRKQGFFKTGYERILLRLNHNKSALVYTPEERSNGSSEKQKTYQINICDIRNVDQAQDRFRLYGKTGDLLLDCDASSSEDSSYFSEMADVLANLMEKKKNTTDKSDQSVVEKKQTMSQSMKEKAEKQLYFAKREKELKEKSAKAKARKDKFMKESGGLKYTAIAMAKS